MRAPKNFLVGIAVGCVLILFLDPSAGARRRALARDKLRRLLRRSREAAGTTRRDLRNRAKGVAATLRSRREACAVSDDVLLERIRARLGHVVSHPRAIDVGAHHGVVRLSGTVLAAQHRSVLIAIANIVGVSEVHDDLELYGHAETPASRPRDGTNGPTRIVREPAVAGD